MIMYTKRGDNLRLNDEINLSDNLQFYIIMNKKVFLVNGSIFFIYADIYYSFLITDIKLM